MPTMDILVRGDSDFATPDIYDLCVLHQNQYLIRLKATNNLYHLAEEIVLHGNDGP